MKKVLSLVLSLALACGVLVGLTACKEEDTRIKIGLIALHDDNSTYDKNFIDAFKAACKAKDVNGIIKDNINEDAGCTTAANELVADGCKLVFADSFGHEEFLRAAAAAHPDVQFCHATGTSMQNDTTLTNFHNAFASIYEGRFLAGYAAGLKLKFEIRSNASIVKDGVVTVGYVGAYPYAEVKSGYTSWLLGVRRALEDEVSVKTVNMKVQFTNSWYDETAEGDAAAALIQAGCVLISQHADSWGAPKACEAAGVPNVSYNGSTESQCPTTYIVSSRINWQPYFEYIIDCVKNGQTIAKDWVAGLGDTIYNGSVCLEQFGSAATAGTDSAVAGVAAQLRAGTIKVFDTSKFTIKAYSNAGYPALTDVSAKDGVLISAKQNGVEVVKTTGSGITYFDESNTETNRSAPYFDIDIEGIEIISNNNK